MGDVELVGLYWTLSGPVEVHSGREWSLFDFRDRVAEAQRVGFAGIGIWHADLEHVLEQRSLREMKEILDGHGVRVSELEFLMDWFLDPGDERRQASDRSRALLFEAAAVFGAPAGAAAWRDIPALYLVCADDRSTAPALQRQQAARAARVIELPTSHHPFLSRPDLVAAAIESAPG